LAFPAAAVATDGSATVGGGDLTMGIPSAVSFAGTLTGQQQTLSANQALDISDLRGTGEGWSVALTTTQFATATATLPTDAATDFSSTGACDSVDPDDCLMAPDSTTAIAIPAAAIAPTAVAIQSSGTDAGMGAMTFTHLMHLVIPSTARAGAYSSTWTYSLISSP
jgi:hypothetical protein